MLGSAGLHLDIGLGDAFGALTFAQRIVGAIFTLAGAFLGLATLAGCDYWGRRQFKLSGAIVLVGALLTLATDVLLLLMWFEEREYTPYLLAFVSLFLWSLWMLWLLKREKPWKDIPHPTRFAAGVVVTALLTSVSLAYSTMYQPTAAPVHLALKVEFGTSQASPDPRYVQVPLKLYAKNDGGIPVYIINSDYSVMGSLVKYSASGEGLKWWEITTESQGYATEAERFALKGGDSVVSSGVFPDPGSWLDIGEQLSEETVVKIPRNSKYDTLRARLIIDFMRKDRGVIDEEFSVARFSWKEDEGSFYCPPNECGDYGGYVVYRGRVRHNNKLINVTRGPRYVTTFWGPNVYENYIWPYSFKRNTLQVYRDAAAAQQARTENERERERYGAGTVETSSEVPIKDLLSQPEG